MRGAGREARVAGRGARGAVVRGAGRGTRGAVVLLVLLVLSVLGVGIGAQHAPAAPPQPATHAPQTATRAPQPAARAPQPAKKELPVPFAVGETLSYDVSWSSTLTAGTATLRVAEKKPSYNSVAYYIVSEGRPSALVSKLYTLYYKVDSLLDVYTLLPQRASLYSEEGKRHRMKSTMFDHQKKTAEYQVETRTVVKKNVAISGVSQDPLGAMFVLRSIPLKPGEKITMPICDTGAN
jgi:uncharacterized protein DUF3108